MPEIDNVQHQTNYHSNPKISNSKQWRLIPSAPIIAVMSLGSLLYITNPSQNDFQQYVREIVDRKVPSENPIGRVLLSTLINNLVNQETYYKNYYLFTKFVVNTATIRVLQEDLPPTIEVIGFFGTFVPLKPF